ASPRLEPGPAPVRQVPRASAGAQRARHGDREHAARLDERQGRARSEPRRRAPRRSLVGGAMSRIGKRPIEVPQGVTVTIDGSNVAVKGPRGELTRRLPADIAVTLQDNQVVVARPSEDKRHKALHGLTRTLVANMVDGVSKGFTRTLEIQGVGYRAEAKPYGVFLALGFSHPVEYKAPAGIKIAVDNTTTVRIEGADKEAVGQVAAEIRNLRPPEPYKGKGIRYQGEQVRRKAGKTGAK